MENSLIYNVSLFVVNCIGNNMALVSTVVLAVVGCYILFGGDEVKYY